MKEWGTKEFISGYFMLLHSKIVHAASNLLADPSIANWWAARFKAEEKPFIELRYSEGMLWDYYMNEDGTDVDASKYNQSGPRGGQRWVPKPEFAPEYVAYARVSGKVVPVPK